MISLIFLSLTYSAIGVVTENKLADMKALQVLIPSLQIPEQGSISEAAFKAKVNEIYSATVGNPEVLINSYLKENAKTVESIFQANEKVIEYVKAISSHTGTARIVARISTERESSMKVYTARASNNKLKSTVYLLKMMGSSIKFKAPEYSGQSFEKYSIELKQQLTHFNDLTTQFVNDKLKHASSQDKPELEFLKTQIQEKSLNGNPGLTAKLSPLKTTSTALTQLVKDSALFPEAKTFTRFVGPPKTRTNEALNEVMRKQKGGANAKFIASPKHAEIIRSVSPRPI